MIEAWGRLVARRPWTVLTSSLVVVVAATAYGLGVFGALSDGGFFVPESESWRAEDTLREHFPDQAVDVVVVYHSDTMTVDDAGFRSAVEDVVDRVTAAAPDTVVLTYYGTGSPALVSEDQHSTQVLLALTGGAGGGVDDGGRLRAYRSIEDHLSAQGLTTHVGGGFALFDDVDSQVKADIARAETISMPLVFILSLIIFGSVTAALMPTMVGGVAVVGAFSLVRALTEVTDVSVFAINVITLMGMGLAIDYALFVVSRFREELAQPGSAQTGDRREALVRTMATSGRTVFFSGVIVAASLSSLLLFPLDFLRSMGYGGVAAVLVAMTASLTILPAVLVLLGPRIDWGRIRRRRTGRHSRANHRWAALAHSVMRRPVAYIVVISALLLLLGSPILSARFGAVDERALPTDAPSRVTMDLLREDFGGETSTAEVLVSGGERAEVRSYANRLGEVAGIQSAAVVARSTGGDQDVSLIRATWPGNSETESSQQRVRDLRDVETPSGSTVDIGGASASTVDLVDAILSRLPAMAGMVAVIMMVLLFVAFGSVVLPIKAILMNTVSIAASFGVVTWIFQDGHLSGVLDFTPEGFLDATEPILMLAILFGLSMDYEVFLLSRIREEWDLTQDNTTAVAAGLQHTGGIITSAALLLAVVIGGFATSDIVMIKMVGVGMLVAVLLDATVVRALLVPATMRLLGRLNWWAPGPLARWWEQHGRFAHGHSPGPSH
ncbi:MAG: MMPL family transporter [Nocardioides sp.]|uniref:MMPL family transporter n=1 Tax=Nocardioides sp. TaxID=35761 RepID=UPI0039E5301F